MIASIQAGSMHPYIPASVSSSRYFLRKLSRSEYCSKRSRSFSRAFRTPSSLLVKPEGSHNEPATTAEVLLRLVLLVACNGMLLLGPAKIGV